MNQQQNSLEQFLCENLNISQKESQRKKDILFHVQKKVNLQEIMKILQYYYLNNNKFPLYTLEQDKLQINLQSNSQQQEQFKKIPRQIKIDENEFSCQYSQYEKNMKVYYDQLRELICNSQMRKFFDQMDFLLYYHIKENYTITLFQFDIDNEAFFFGLESIKILFKDFKFGRFQEKIIDVMKSENLINEKSDFLEFKISFFLFLNLYDDFLNLYLKAVHFLNNQQ